MASTQEILEQKNLIDNVAEFIGDELDESQSEVAWILLDALAAFGLKLVVSEENVASQAFLEVE